MRGKTIGELSGTGGDRVTEPVPALEGSFEHILCGVDGSAPACRAAETAARLARALNGRLTFLVVAPEAASSAELDRYREVEGIGYESVPAVPIDASACLTSALTIAYRVGVAEAASRVMTGKIVPTICQATRSLGADCLVLGRRRHGLLTLGFRGSIGRGVANGCDCPVLSVR